MDWHGTIMVTVIGTNTSNYFAVIGSIDSSIISVVDQILNRVLYLIVPYHLDSTGGCPT